MTADGPTAVETSPKDRLHRLVDALPAGEHLAAERYLEFLSGHGHPFVRTLSNAPEADEPLSKQERAALEEGRKALDEGDTVSDRELCNEIGI